MFLAEQLTAFYPDLLDERFVSQLRDLSPALFDQHLPALAAGAAVPHARAQRRDQHAQGQRQLDEEPRDPHGRPRPSATISEDMKPIIQPGGSDSAALDNVFEVLVRAGRAAPMAKTLLIPEAWSQRARRCPQAHRDLYTYCNAVMEPWDGPAAICADRRPLGDRRPGPQRLAADALRLTDDGAADRRLGNRHGAARREPHRREGPRRPGPDDRRRSRRGPALSTTARLKDQLAAHAPLSATGSRTSPSIDSLISSAPGRAAHASTRAELRRRQLAAGITHGGPRADPPAHGRGRARKPSARWATTRRWRCCPTSYRPPAPFLPAEFQPGHQPADRFAARRAGDEPEARASAISATSSTQDESQADVLQLESPVLPTAEFQAHARLYGRERAARSTAPSTPANGRAPKRRAARRDPTASAREAEDAVRGGCAHIDPDRRGVERRRARRSR